MNKEEYIEIRRSGVELNSKLMHFDTLTKDRINKAAKLLGMMDGKIIAMQNENESDFLSDFMLFEKYSGNSRLIDEFYDSEIELADLEEEILEGLLNNCSSLYQVVAADKAQYSLQFRDLLNPSLPELTVIDINFSQNYISNVLFFTRLIPIRDLYMSSGAIMGFNFRSVDQLLADLSVDVFKKRRKLGQAELFLFFFKKYRQLGLNSYNREV